jgi:hypothetical protein
MKTKLLYVSSTSTPNRADGSAKRPYATLEAARDALRKLRAQDGMRMPVRVLVAPGIYRLDRPLVFSPEDGGTAKCPVTWAGDGGRPILSGARAITGWTQGAINGRRCWQAHVPDVAAGKWWFTQIFVNGRRRLRARLPKQGFYRFTGVSDEEAKKDTGDEFHPGMSALFESGEVRNFRNLDDIDVVVPDRWFESHLRIASVDEAARTIHFSTRGLSRLSRDETGRPARFRLDHVAEGCTEPGDWYLDRKTGTLSYIPMPREQMDSALVEAPMLDLLLAVQGDPLDPEQRVRHLRFECLDLRHTDWELPRENPGARQSAFNVPAAVRLVGAEDCALYGCRVSQVGGWAVEVLRGCHRNRVVACTLHDLGGGGVKIGHEGGLPREWVDGSTEAFIGMDAGGIDPQRASHPQSAGAFIGMDAVALGWGPCREDAGGLLPGRDRAEASATTVSDCSIHDGGLIFHSAIGVWIGDASRNRVLHNHIWNLYYSGISSGWTWNYRPAFSCGNRIEGNRIHAIGRGVLSDVGGIYLLGRQAGSTIRRNVISDVWSYDYGGNGIYCDVGIQQRIEENIVHNTRSASFNQSQGRDSVIRHNLFADAAEGNMRVLHRQMTRAGFFTDNLIVQGEGAAPFWRGAGAVTVGGDRNVYLKATGGLARFAGGSWEEWQAAGRDRRGRVALAGLLDIAGLVPAMVQSAAVLAVGVDPAIWAAVAVEAGPRFRGTLPQNIDLVPAEAEPRRPIVETMLWPWPAEWPDAASAHHPWGDDLPGAVAVAAGEAQVVSLALENRGDAPARGAYRLRVVPAAAAVIRGPRELKVALKPDARIGLDTAVVATGKHKTFRVEAVAEGKELLDSCLHFVVVPAVTIPRLSAARAGKNLDRELETLTSLAVDGNGRLVQATVRLAMAGDRLLVRVDVADAAPRRGPNLWDGSGLELFVAPEPGKPRVQFVAAPSLDREPAQAGRIARNGLEVLDDVVAAGGRTPAGWQLTLAVPLERLGLASNAVRFALDLVINATPPGANSLRRTHLACELNPFSDSSCYARVRVAS